MISSIRNLIIRSGGQVLRLGAASGEAEGGREGRDAGKGGKGREVKSKIQVQYYEGFVRLIR